MGMCSLESGVCCSEDGVLCSAYDSRYYCGILCSGCRRRNIRIYLERCGHIGKYARLLTGRARKNNCLRNAECIFDFDSVFDIAQRKCSGIEVEGKKNITVLYRSSRAYNGKYYRLLVYIACRAVIRGNCGIARIQCICLAGCDACKCTCALVCIAVDAVLNAVYSLNREAGFVYIGKFNARRNRNSRDGKSRAVCARLGGFRLGDAGINRIFRACLDFHSVAGKSLIFIIEGSLYCIALLPCVSTVKAVFMISTCIERDICRAVTCNGRHRRSGGSGSFCLLCYSSYIYFALIKREGVVDACFHFFECRLACTYVDIRRTYLCAFAVIIRSGDGNIVVL